MQVVFGQSVFVTLSPNRRHSGLILKLSRSRVQDVGIDGDDDISRQKKRFCGANTPSIFHNGFLTSPEDVESAYATLDFPSLQSRQGLNAQDPLSGVHYYLICMFVALPGVAGLRMCMNCPHCNMDKNDPDCWGKSLCSCQDFFGRNTKPMG